MQAEPGPPLKVVLFANTDWYLFNFRLALAMSLRDRGWQVVLVSPPGRYGPLLGDAGFRWVPFPFERRGLNPFGALRTVWRLVRLYRRERPSLVHHFTLKCVLYGSVAARMAFVPGIVNALTGLGHVFVDRSPATRALHAIAKILLRTLLQGTEVIFQNPDDAAEFVRRRLVRPKRAHVIRGSGVDVAKFRPAPGRPPPGAQVLFASRLLWSKGLAELVEASAIVCTKHPQTIFLIAGEADPGNPASVSVQTIDQWKRHGAVRFIGHCDDILSLLHASTLVVLPSYREGTPRILLEAAACGLPLVATDVPGCREIVRAGVNGLLVPARDPARLAAAILQLLDDPLLRESMGRQSRDIACREFGEQRVVTETLRTYEVALGRVRHSAQPTYRDPR